MLYWRARWSSAWQQVHWGRWRLMLASYQSTAQARFHQTVHPQSSSVWSHDYARSACYTNCDFSKYLIGFFFKQLMLRQSQTCDHWSRTYSKDCFISRSTFSGMTFFFYVASFWPLLSVINFLSHEEEIVSSLQAHGNTSLWFLGDTVILGTASLAVFPESSMVYWSRVPWPHTAWFCIPAPTLTSYGTWGKLTSPCFSFWSDLASWYSMIQNIIMLVEEINELIDVKCFNSAHLTMPRAL